MILRACRESPLLTYILFQHYFFLITGKYFVVRWLAVRYLHYEQ